MMAALTVTEAIKMKNIFNIAKSKWNSHKMIDKLTHKEYERMCEDKEE
jgi:hypothetical protein